MFNKAKCSAAMKVLIACEESQAVCKAFRARGHVAFSCDLLECSGDHPEWHIVGNVLSLLDGDCMFVTQSGKLHLVSGPWDMIVAFPPCTYLSRAGSYYLYHPADKHLPVAMRRAHPDHPQRRERQKEAVEFVLRIWTAQCPRICIENPPGHFNTIVRPSQTIHPYMHGHPYTKATSLWLKGLACLQPSDMVEPLPSVKIGSHGRSYGAWWAHTMRYPLKQRARIRSKTFVGIANAMAEQWGACTYHEQHKNSCVAKTLISSTQNH